MNNFDAKYLKLSSEYLQDKLNRVKTKNENIQLTQKSKKKESSLKRFVSSIFKS